MVLINEFARPVAERAALDSRCRNLADAGWSVHCTKGRPDNIGNGALFCDAIDDLVLVAIKGDENGREISRLEESVMSNDPHYRTVRLWEVKATLGHEWQVTVERRRRLRQPGICECKHPPGSKPTKRLRMYHPAIP